jgi:hypothetical protein
LFFPFAKIWHVPTLWMSKRSHHVNHLIEHIPLHSLSQNSLRTRSECINNLV